MIPVFAHPEIAARLQDDVRRAMAARVPAFARPRPFPKVSQLASGPRAGATAERILAVMAKAPAARFRSRDLADALDMSIHSVTPALSRLEGAGRIRRAARSDQGRILYELVPAMAGGDLGDAA